MTTLRPTVEQKNARGEVMSLPQNETAQTNLAVAVAQTYPADHKKLPFHGWLVAAKGSALDVSAALGVTLDAGAGPTGSTMVLEVSSYYGVANKDIWDWIKGKLEAPGG